MLAACCVCVVCLNTSPVGSEARSVVLALASDALPKGGTLSPSSPASTGVRLPPTNSCQPHGGRHYKARFGCYLIAHKSSVCNARSYPEYLPSQVASDGIRPRWGHWNPMEQEVGLQPTHPIVSEGRLATDWLPAKPLSADASDGCVCHLTRQRL